MSLLAKSKGEVTYKDLTGFHKWFLIVLVSMGSSIIYTPIYLKNVFYEPLMQGLGCTNADLGALLSCYAIVAVITYLPAGIIADKVRMRTLSWVGFGGVILTNDEDLFKKINSAVFPGSQGGPLMHVIAGKAVAFGEALQPAFKEYINHVVENAAAMGQGMTDGGLRLVSGGTDNHLCLVDLTPADVTGKDAEKLLESVGLTVNKNTIPNEQRSPFVASGIRVGSAAATSRGFTKEDFYEVGQCIAATVFNAADEAKLADVKAKIDAMLEKHPLYPGLEY